MYGIHGILKGIYDFKRTRTTGLIGFLQVGKLSIFQALFCCNVKHFPLAGYFQWEKYSKEYDTEY